MGKKKIEIPEDILSEMIRLYNEEYVGTPSLSDKFGYHKSIILRSFKNKGIGLGPSGRKWTGGKEVSIKKYHSKPEVKKEKVKITKYGPKKTENIYVNIMPNGVK